MPEEIEITSLTGEELLKHLATLGDFSRSKQAIACGYIYPKSGRPNVSAFCAAIADAAAPSRPRKKGRTVKEVVEVPKGKTLTLSQYRLKQINAEVGDRLKIEAIEIDGEMKIVISRFKEVEHGS